MSSNQQNNNTSEKCKQMELIENPWFWATMVLAVLLFIIFIGIVIFMLQKVTTVNLSATYE